VDLTARQRNEFAYHAQHASRFAAERPPTEEELLRNPRRKWWNHYWAAYALLVGHGLSGKSVLVPGCGTGVDAINCVRLGASVTAIDLSPHMLELAIAAAAREPVAVKFLQMPAESLEFAEGTFDVVFIRDLLHHCNIPACMDEVVRVARDGALIVIDELYTHSALQRLRNGPIGRSAYGRLRPVIYAGGEPYITPDERKIDERELDIVLGRIRAPRVDFFNVVVNRFCSDADNFEKADRLLTRGIGPLGRILAGRVLVSGRIQRGHL
jgi:SAM-dependent methyltransferase